MSTQTVIIPIQLASFTHDTTEMLDAFGISVQEFLHFIVDSYSYWECEPDIRTTRIEWFLRQHNDGEESLDYAAMNGWYSWQHTVEELEKVIMDVKRQMDPCLVHLGTFGNRWSYLTLLRTIGTDLVVRVTPPITAFHHA